jgi:SnoaL-like domain
MAAKTIFNEADNVSSVLDLLHKYASIHDSELYLELFSEDAVFLGTDALERWDKAAMAEWVIPLFNSGRGWTYVSKERRVYLSDDGSTAWFDEQLINEKFGDCRGSGVLKKIDTHWKLAQYNLTIPIPNEIALSVVDMIKEGEDKK